MAAHPTLVIVGGGFAGTTLARALEARLPAHWQLLLVSEESYTTFHPMLAEVVGAAVFPEQVIAPIRAMLGRTRFVMGRVGHIDLQQRRIACHTLAGERWFGYDELVLAVGQRAHLGLLPGATEHALPLKLVGDALHLRNRVLQRLAAIELAGHAAERRALGHFVVIGGGFSGVEVAGSIADALRSALRYYPRVDPAELRVTLLHDGDRLLPELPERLGIAAGRALQQRGIELRLGVRASGVYELGVTLERSEVLASRTVVCTIGTQRQALIDRLAGELGVPLQRGRLPTAPSGRVAAAPGLWALGDCAALPNAAEGGATSPPTAQFAVAQARQLADNIVAHIEGGTLRPFAHRSRGMMATTGHRAGVALLGRLPLTGLPAWLLWRAYYLMRLPSWGRRLRVWVEWTWSLFFPLDITHLRFTRTPESEAAREAVPEAAPPLPVLAERPAVTRP
jgi:NADH dehydrogenase